MKIDRYQFEETAETLLARFAAIHAGDKKAERASKLWGGGCAVALLGLFGSFFIFEEIGVLAAIPMAVLLGFGIFCLRMMKVHQERDLEDRKVATIQKLVQVLRADVTATQPIKVDVDFRDYQKAGENRAPGSWSHTWLRVSTTLADGTAVALGLSEDVKRKEKRKRKYTKVRERIVGEPSIDLRLGRQYGDADAAAERLKATGPPPGFSLASVTGTGRRLHLTLRTGSFLRLTGRGGTASSTGEVPDADTLLVALRWTYRGLAPSA